MFKMIPRRRLHRSVFVVAGLYNLAWGFFSAVHPQGFFRLVGLPDLNHPSVFACLGMVVGIYGLLYWEVARVPEHGGAIAAVGLLGKILGPFGMAYLVLEGTWPLAAGLLCVTNDLIWWPFFGLYLKDAWSLRPAARR